VNGACLVASSRLRIRSLVVAGVATASLLGAVVVPGVGEARPAPTIAQVEAQVTVLEGQAEAAQEDANKAQTELAAGELRLRALEAEVSKAKSQIGRAQTSLGQLAAAVYREGGVDQTLRLLFADNPARFLSEAAALESVSRNRSDTVRTLTTAQGRLAQANLLAAQEVGRLQQIRDRAAKHKQQVDALFLQQKRLLSSLRAEQRAELARQQAAELARQLREQRALELANAARTSAAPVRSTPSRASGPSTRPGPARATKPANVPGYTGGSASIGQRALQWALRQVGKAYVYAGVGPTSFDCSGLTMMAYRSAGVSLPRYGGHGGQADVGHRVPLSQLRPGDLILYYPPSLHHIAMYAGNNRIVHAANPRRGVVTAPLDSMPIAFAVRPY
jgi:peptidoglycan DL-endopeptidase CwlO